MRKQHWVADSADKLFNRGREGASENSLDKLLSEVLPALLKGLGVEVGLGKL